MKNNFPEIIQVKRLVYGDTGKWCQLPYPNHPKGCPQYGKKRTCPPLEQPIEEVLDVEEPIYIAYSEFDLENHVKKMKRKHKHWSGKQCRSVLYWQRTSRKHMRVMAKDIMYITDANYSIECPEGMGINVYATCALSGLKLEKIKGLKICRHIAFVGFRKGGDKLNGKLF